VNVQHIADGQYGSIRTPIATNDNPSNRFFSTAMDILVFSLLVANNKRMHGALIFAKRLSSLRLQSVNI
jgi:hypothetical protein